MRLAITGLGMLSTLGDDVISSCAALRCGLVRPAPLRFEVYSEDEEEGVARVVGHPLQGVTNGFEGIGLYINRSRFSAHLLAFPIARRISSSSTRQSCAPESIARDILMAFSAAASRPAPTAVVNPRSIMASSAAAVVPR